MKYSNTAGLLEERLKSSRINADGAFGTYYAKIYDEGSLPEMANVSAPARVLAIHRAH